jgi:chromosome segregation ATPase
MSDDGAFSGAMMLSQQLRMYRWMDTLERARNNNELAIDNALLRHDAEQIVGRYNQLVAEFNDLLRRATEVAKEADRKDSIIAGLQHEAEELRSGKAVLEAECQRLRAENTGQAIRIQWLSDMVQQDRPGYLPDR